MIVKELIEILKQYPSNTPVILSDSEQGYMILKEVTHKKVYSYDQNSFDWYAPSSDYKKVKVVILGND